MSADPITLKDQRRLRTIRSRLGPADRALFDRAVRQGLPDRLAALLWAWFFGFLAGAVVWGVSDWVWRAGVY